MDENKNCIWAKYDERGDSLECPFYSELESYCDKYKIIDDEWFITSDAVWNFSNRVCAFCLKGMLVGSINTMLFYKYNDETKPHPRQIILTEHEEE